MMDFEEFSETILKEVRKKTEGMFDVSITVNMKNNGIHCTGISAIAKERNNGPCIYLDGYYKEYGNGSIELYCIADKVYRQIMEHEYDLRDIEIMDFLNWNNIRCRIYAKLINADRNRELLKDIPHRMFLDLAVVYYAAVNVFDIQKTATILIHNHHMSIWGEKEETLYQTALLNMRSDCNPLIEDMQNILKSFVPEVFDIWGKYSLFLNMGAYILTNCRKHYGAAEILDKNTLKEISDKIRNDYILLPSSVHEVIVLSAGQNMGYGELAEMVRQVNAEEVSAEEYLSDHVYVYNRSEESLRIAA